MDGSGFLHELPDAPSLGGMFGLGRSDGILYVEDFDLPPPARAPDPAPEPPPPDPVFTAADIASAREAGRAEGLAAALQDAHLVQLQVQAAATQALADALAASRATLDRMAAQQADAAARAALAILRSAIPGTMAQHGKAELQAVIEALLPGLRCEPDLRVRVNPDLADHVRETLIELLGDDRGVLSVIADPDVPPGDVQIAWSNGGARRDGADIYAELSAALAPLDLPAIEEIRFAERN